MKNLSTAPKLALLFSILLFSQHLFAQSFTNNFFQVDLFCYQNGVYKGEVSDDAARKGIVDTYGPDATSGKSLVSVFNGAATQRVIVNVAADYAINTPSQPINPSYVVDTKKTGSDPKLVVFANVEEAGAFCSALFHACKLQYGGEDNEYGVRGGSYSYGYTYNFGLYDEKMACTY